HALEKAQTDDGISRMITALPADPAFRLLDVGVRQHGKRTTVVGNGAPVQIEYVYEVLERASGLRVYFDLCDEEYDMLVRSFHDADADHMPVTQPGRYRAVAEIPADLLAPRDYHLRLRATLFHIRHLTGDGVPIVLRVQHTSSHNRAYPDEPISGKLNPAI